MKTHGTLSSRIEICGGIASGKTTLATVLDRYATTAVVEDFQGNPFWNAFYSDPIANAFETEVTFLLQHYHDIKTAAKRSSLFVCDFSLLLDAAYAKVTLDKGKRTAFAAVYGEVRAELPSPNLVIHLICDPTTQLKRIRRRGREVERSITLEYLDAINAALGAVIRDEAEADRVLTINSAELDFANDETVEKHVCELVLARFKSTNGEAAA